MCILRCRVVDGRYEKFEELDERLPSLMDTPNGIAKFDEVKDFPYLNTEISEVLCYRPTSALGLSRLVLKSEQPSTANSLKMVSTQCSIMYIYTVEVGLTIGTIHYNDAALGSGQVLAVTMVEWEFCLRKEFHNVALRTQSVGGTKRRNNGECCRCSRVF